MTRMQWIRTVALCAAVVSVTANCDDGTNGRTPTEPGLNAEGAQASFSHDGRDGDDGSGSRFKLFGDAQVTRDPENPSNIVLRIVSTGAPTFTAAGAERKLRVKIWQLDHQLNFHRAFVAPNTCDGGSPRIQLLIDANGDGKFEQAPRGPDVVAHGHVRPPWAACETSAPTPSNGEMASPSTLLWRFEDLTDELARWEITPGGVVNLPNVPGTPYASWDALEQAIGTAFPNHRVIKGSLVEDFNATAGVAYYDLVTIFDLTLGTRGQFTPERRGDRNDDSED